MNYASHMYMMLYPHNALVASQLEPELLAQHYTAGSSRHYRGKAIFAEIDLDYRNDYFRIEETLDALAPHEDGTPKATRNISTYRVLEHVDLSAILRLFLTTQEGYCIGLDPEPLKVDMEEGIARIYAGITPMTLLTLSKTGFSTFGAYVTEDSNPKATPRQFFTQLDLDIEDFLEEFALNSFRPSPFPNVHPAILREAFHELERNPDKLHRGIGLDSNLDGISYKLIRGGFMIAGFGENIFFPMPAGDDIEQEHYKFWRTM